MTPKQPRQYKLSEALNLTGLTEQFQCRATPETPSSDLLKWCRNHPKLKALNVQFPVSLAYLREKLGCKGEHGGKRANQPQGPHFMVSNGRIAVQNGRRVA